ncbi:hypothetical protein DCM91_13295, partial [Chitinophaga costaii]
MRIFFTLLKTCFFVVYLSLTGLSGHAQTYTEALVESARADRYTAIAKDDAGNIYVVRPGTLPGYEVAKYTNGTGTPTVIFSNLHSNPDALSQTYPYGITVDGNGNVFVVDAFNSGTENKGQIIKLTPNGSAYTASTFAQGAYYTAITHDADNNIYTLEYDGTANYGVSFYSAGSNQGSLLWHGLPVVPKDAGTLLTSEPWGLVVDAAKNIYFTTFLEGTGSFDVGGDILKLAPPYASSDLSVMQAGNGYTALAMGSNQKFYTVEYNSGKTAYEVRVYDDLSKPGLSLYSGLILTPQDGLTYPLGLAIRDNAEIYTADVDQSNGLQGRLHRLSTQNVTVKSIDRALPSSITNAPSVTYTVTFSSDVTGVTASSFSLTTTGGVGASIKSVTPVSGSVYTVTVDPIAGNGTIRLDLTGNGITPQITNAPFTGGEVYTIDQYAPTVTLSSTATSPLRTAIPVTITFSEAVTGLSTADINVTNGTASNLQTADNITYTATITPAADGTVTVQVPAGAAQDAATNDNTKSNLLTYTYDATPPAAPVITGVDGNNPSNTANNVLQGTAEANSTVKISRDGAVSVTTRADASGKWTFSTGDLAPGTYNYTATATDAAGNSSPVSNTYSLVVDLTPPTVTSVAIPANGTYKAGDKLTFTVHFSENITVTGVPQLPITIGTSTVNADYTGGTGSTALTFTYTVKAGDNDNDGITPGAALLANGGTLTDAAGNAAVLTLNNIASTAQVLVDAQSPTVTLSSTATSPLGTSFSVIITFSEEVNDFTVSGISISNIKLKYLVTSNYITYTVTIIPDADGAVTIQVPAGAAHDAANNDNIESNLLTFIYDATPPAAPVITGVDGNNPSNTANNVLQGTAEANSTVKISRD